MTGEKGPSIPWVDFNRLVPNGAWVQWRVGATDVVPPLKGLVIWTEQDEIAAPSIDGDKVLRVTSTATTDVVRLRVADVEYSIDDEWIDFRELCIRATEQRLRDTGATAPDAHPLTWMTHATELNMSVAQIGTMLYETAAWIEAAGNKGYSDDDLMKALPALRIRLLKNAYKLAWQDILFFGEGGKKRDFDGWGVHKRTPAHWTVTWLARFGTKHPLADQLMDQAWDEALATHEKRAVKRVHQTYAGVDLETADTRDIAHKAAAMWLMGEWAHQRGWAHRETREMWRLQGRLYLMAHDVFRHELVYRMDQQPQPRRSKKKTQLAREDWATASTYFGPQSGFFGEPYFNALHFYTAAYVEACCESDVAPDVSVDFEALPRGLRGAVAASDTVTTEEEAEV